MTIDAEVRKMLRAARQRERQAERQPQGKSHSLALHTRLAFQRTERERVTGNVEQRTKPPHAKRGGN